jgi:hypothetical protein
LLKKRERLTLGRLADLVALLMAGTRGDIFQIKAMVIKRI